MRLAIAVFAAALVLLTAVPARAQFTEIQVVAPAATGVQFSVTTGTYGYPVYGYNPYCAPSYGYPTYPAYPQYPVSAPITIYAAPPPQMPIHQAIFNGAYAPGVQRLPYPYPYAVPGGPSVPSIILAPYPAPIPGRLYWR